MTIMASQAPRRASAHSPPTPSRNTLSVPHVCPRVLTPEFYKDDSPLPLAQLRHRRAFRDRFLTKQQAALGDVARGWRHLAGGFSGDDRVELVAPVHA